MTLHALREYAYRRPAQWRAGLRHNWLEDAGGLVATPMPHATLLPGAGRLDANSAVAWDPAGTLTWLRPGSLDRVRTGDAGTIVVDPLRLRLDPSRWRPRELVVGHALTWALLYDDDGTTLVVAVSNETLCETVRVEPDHRIVAITGAPRDGLLAIAVVDGQHWVVAVSKRGNVRRFLRVDKDAGAAGVPTIDGAWIARIHGTDGAAVLVRYADDHCARDCRRWRILRFDPGCGPSVDDAQLRVLFGADRKPVPCVDDPPVFVPDAIDVDCRQTVYVVNRVTGELLATGLCGAQIGQWRGVFDRVQLPLHDFEVLHDPAASGAVGIYRVDAGGQPGHSAEAYPAVFLTPAMHSPPAIDSGWARLDIDIDFAGRSKVQVDIAHTSDAALIEDVQRVQANTSVPLSVRLNRLGARLPWDVRFRKVFVADQWPKGRPLRLPLHEIESTHLWVMVTLTGDRDAPPAVIRSVVVRYPNLSLSSYLPEVYREDPIGAGNLRRMLAIIESVFGDLDATLAGLPANLDPRTAPAEWIPYLLRWLGFPPATELDVARQRRLLLEAPDLLRWRGTLSGVERLLALLVDGDVAVRDVAAGPAPWALPARSRAALGARLGHETLVLCAGRPGFRPGREAVLGSARLGYQPLRTRDLFDRQSARIGIAIALRDGDEEAARSLVTRFLPYFIPAHCNYRIHFVDGSLLPPPEIFTSATEFRGRGSARVGQSLRLGDARLSAVGDGAPPTTLLNSKTVMRSGDILT